MDFPKLGDGSNWLFADSGSFSARNNDPQLFLKHPIEKLYQFYEKFPFSYIVEPDYIANDYNAQTEGHLSYNDIYDRNLEFSAQLGVFRSQVLESKLGSQIYGKVVRPIHGYTADQRIRYLERLELHLEKVNYIGLGGLETTKFDKKEFDQTLVGLTARDIRKVHFFSRNSPDFLDYAISKLDTFDEVSVDGSSWWKKANLRQVHLFNRETDSLKNLTFRAKEKLKKSDLETLGTCECPACTYPSLGKHERDDFFELPFLAEASHSEHPAYEKFFVWKAALHNLWHQAEYIKHRLRNPKR
jgi:hypothetical protein